MREAGDCYRRPMQHGAPDTTIDVAAPGAGWAERDRLAALDRYAILDTPAEPEFDDIARLAADIFSAPIAVVNLIAGDRQWFKAEIGIGARSLPLEVSICAHAILQADTMVVPDTRLDPRFVNNPLVTADGGLRFYAGALLRTPEGMPLGTVCVLDHAPRPEGLSDRQRRTLEVLARQAMTQLELRRALSLRDSDIAHRRRAEAELQQLNETLEQRIAAALAARELAQDALRQSQKMEAMGQLTGGVAHDFNNLLTPIIGSLDLLQRRGVGSDRERRLIDGALLSAERAKMLVQRLLAFARRQPLQPTAIDLAALVRGMSDLVASTSGPQTRIQLDLALGLPPAVADANQLEMALLNLCVNARDAMPAGGTLTIAAAAERIAAGHRSGIAPGRYLRLSVGDTGTGMSAETAERAIEPFFSTKGIGKGTGLGLSMVHGLAMQLGGGLAITSEAGRGTCIDLWLPEGAADPATAPADAAGAARRRCGRALVVDDDAAVRMTTGDMLSELGYEIVEAVSGDEAQRLLDEGLEADLVVTDHLMPGLTGAELARSIRRRTPGVPVLLVSGYAEADGIASDLPRLTKPFRQIELAAMVAEIAGDPPPR